MDFLKAVVRATRDRRFDLVHSHGYSAALASAPVALTRHIPHLMTSHEPLTEGQFYGIRGYAKKLALGAVLSTVTRIHCVSNDAKENLLEYIRIPRISSDKVTTIPHGIAVKGFLTAPVRKLRDELAIEDDAFVIGYLGRFMSPKGFKYLLDAFEALSIEPNLPRRPILLTFGADGFIREEQAEVRRRGLERSVKFLPFVPDVASTLKGLDVVVMPSLWEACGLLAMETMVAGTPLIGTSCIGLREVLKGTPATSVPPRDGQAIAAALKREMLAPSKAQAEAFVTEAARRYSVSERARELEQVMLELLVPRHQLEG
jgi:glycosyltransferase involved in cell wall biosynthesis